MSRTVAGFDVFDTVLTRLVGDPEAVFFLVGTEAGKRGLTSLSAGEFAARRRLAQANCHRRSGGGEVTLDEIIGELLTQIDGSARQATALRDAELAVEARLICALPGAPELLAAARSQSSRLIFASDMYLPADFIRACLRAHGCWQEGDSLYVSHEYRRSKRTGELFATILAQEGIAPGQLRHTGNDAEADYAAPRKMGIAATLRPQGNLNRYERCLESYSGATAGLASWLAGASRLARLTISAHTPAEEAIRDVAAGVAAPVLVAYVSWVLRTAHRDGINRLYFVARDGHTLLQLARQLAPRLHPAAELRYLHGSRQAWHLPGVFTVGEDELSWLFCPTDFLSVTSLCGRVGLLPVEISAPLTAGGFPAAGWNENLDAGSRARLRELVPSHAIAHRIQERATLARETLLAYLQQERLLDRERAALVDLGWHGRAHDSLAKVICSAGIPPPAGFYFGLHSASSRRDLGERHAWFFDHRKQTDRIETLPGIEALMEVFCAVDHGATTGYAPGPQGLAPVLRTDGANVRLWGAPLLQAAIIAFGKNLTAAPAGDADATATRSMCLDVLRLFWETPTGAEAQAWGAFPFEDDQTGASAPPLATKFGWGTTAGLLLRGRKSLPRATWWHGSLRLTPLLQRCAMRGAQGLRLAAHAVKQRFYW